MYYLQKAKGVSIFNASFGSVSPYQIYSNEPETIIAKEIVNKNGLIIFASGNEGNSQPSVEASMPNQTAELKKGWIVVTGVDESKKSLYKTYYGAGANACGDAAEYCLAGDFVSKPYYIPDTFASGGKVSSNMGTSFAAPQVTAEAALIADKFSWMQNEQIK